MQRVAQGLGLAAPPHHIVRTLHVVRVHLKPRSLAITPPRVGKGQLGVDDFPGRGQAIQAVGLEELKIGLHGVAEPKPRLLHRIRLQEERLLQDDPRPQGEPGVRVRHKGALPRLHHIALAVGGARAAQQGQFVAGFAGGQAQRPPLVLLVRAGGHAGEAVQGHAVGGVFERGKRHGVAVFLIERLLPGGHGLDGDAALGLGAGWVAEVRNAWQKRLSALALVHVPPHGEGHLVERGLAVPLPPAHAPHQVALHTVRIA